MIPSSEGLEEFEPEYGKKTNRWLGIAPFAKHRGKTYPIDRMEEVVARFAGDNRFTVFLFWWRKRRIGKDEKLEG